MPIIDDFNEIAKSGAAPKGAAPFVFWDGYGLDHIASGITVHARLLAAELVKKEVTPCIIGNQKTSEIFSELPNFILPSKSIFPSIIADSKLFWPLRVKANLEEFAAENSVVLHGLSNINLPIVGSKKSLKKVITVHDPIPLIVPSQVSKPYYIQFKLALPRVLEKADRVVCVSNWTKKELKKLYPQYEEKMVVIQNGRPEIDLPKDKAPNQTGKIRLMSVGRFETYKRIPLLFKLLRANLNFSLTLVTDDIGALKVRQSEAELLAKGQLKLFSNQSQKELKDLYHQADIYIHPSLYEGFCLPAAEALAHGLPVVYQSGSAIDEVCGDQVATPISIEQKDDLSAWAKATTSLLEKSKDPAFGLELSNHLNQLHTWKDAAQSLISVYNELNT